jgi:hypothetical protein
MSATAPESRPEDALASLALLLREEGPVVAEHVAEATEPPALGLLVAAGPRCAADPDAAEIAWLAAAVAIAAGAGEPHEEAKATLRASGDAGPLWEAARERAERAGLSEPLSVAAEAVGFAPPNRG